IVAKTILSARSTQDCSSHLGFEYLEHMALARSSQDAHKTRSAVRVGHTFELAQQASIVGRIVILLAGCGYGYRGIIGSVARRAHAGSAIQREDFQPRIVGK